MRANQSRAQRMLRWYPAAWRERYGSELVDLIDDTYGERPLGARAYASLARTGIVQRLRYTFLLSRPASPGDPVREGALTVWFAWACYVVAGAGFAKYSEHWDVATPLNHRAIPEFAMMLVQVSAFVGAGLCGVAALVSLSSAWRYLRDSGVRRVERLMRSGLVAALLAAISTSVMIAVAHHSSYAQRNGSLGAYRFLGLGWSILLVACLAVMSWNIGRLVRQLEYSPRQLTYLAVVARLLSLTMAVIFASFVLWWMAIARFAPRFLATGLLGVSNSTVSVPMLGSAMLMGTGLVLAARGVRRSWRRPA